MVLDPLPPSVIMTLIFSKIVWMCPLSGEGNGLLRGGGWVTEGMGEGSAEGDGLLKGWERGVRRGMGY